MNSCLAYIPECQTTRDGNCNSTACANAVKSDNSQVCKELVELCNGDNTCILQRCGQ